MEHVEQVAQLKTLMARLDSGTTVDAGGFRLNPVWVYTDPDLADRERAEFFDSHPQVIGLSGDLPEPGSFLTMNDLGTPILATRDHDGRFRAFVNSCRHRGVVLEERPRGSARSFACPFHSWTYDIGGDLVAIPKPEHFGDIDMACHGLVELPAEERHGLLAVHPQPGGTVDIDAMLGDDLAAELHSWGLDGLACLGTDTYAAACNWKLAMDTFGETYHFPTLHQNTLFTVYYGNVQCYDTYGRHHRMLLVLRAIDEMRGLPEDEWDIGKATLPVYWLFPSVQLMPFALGCFLVRAYPDPADPGRHTSRITFYCWPDDVPESARGDALADDEGALRQHHPGGGLRGGGQPAGDPPPAAPSSTSCSAATKPALHHYHNTFRAALGMDPLPLLETVS